MDIRNFLIQAPFKGFIDSLVDSVVNSKENYAELYELLFDENETVAWRAGWAASKVSEKAPELFTNEQIIAMTSLAIQTSFLGLRRGCMLIIYNTNKLDLLSVDFINKCFEWLISPKTPVAIQAYSMKILYEYTIIEPDLAFELKAYLENTTPEDYTPGFNSTRKNILKQLK